MVLGRSPGIPAAPSPQAPSLDVYKPGDVLSPGKKNIGTPRREHHDPHIPQPSVGAVSGKAQSVCVSSERETINSDVSARAALGLGIGWMGLSRSALGSE